MDNTPYLELHSFPKYRFLPDGTPFRKEPSSRGPNCGATEVRGYTLPDGRIVYKMYGLDGKRTTVAKSAILNALRYQEQESDRFYSLAGYSAYVADENGVPYRMTKAGQPRRLSADLRNRSERYVLYSDSGIRRSYSRSTIRAMVDKVRGCHEFA